MFSPNYQSGISVNTKQMIPEHLTYQFRQSHCARGDLDGTGGQNDQRLNTSCNKIQSMSLPKLQREETD